MPKLARSAAGRQSARGARLSAPSPVCIRSCMRVATVAARCTLLQRACACGCRLATLPWPPAAGAGLVWLALSPSGADGPNFRSQSGCTAPPHGRPRPAGGRAGSAPGSGQEAPPGRSAQARPRRGARPSPRCRQAYERCPRRSLGRLCPGDLVLTVADQPFVWRGGPQSQLSVSVGFPYLN
jgi:hypothetical protein